MLQFEKNISERSEIYQEEQFFTQRQITLPPVKKTTMPGLLRTRALLFINYFSFHIQNQTFQIFTFRMVNINRMISRLRQLMKNTNTSSAHGSSRKHCRTKLIL